MPSSDQDRRLRAELAEGLGYLPASLAAEDVARYRDQIAERKAREKSGELVGEVGPETRRVRIRFLFLLPSGESLINIAAGP